MSIDESGSQNIPTIKHIKWAWGNDEMGKRKGSSILTNYKKDKNNSSLPYF